jgi:hypothetical protein
LVSREVLQDFNFSLRWKLNLREPSIQFMLDTRVKLVLQKVSNLNYNLQFNLQAQINLMQSPVYIRNQFKLFISSHLLLIYYIIAVHIMVVHWYKTSLNFRRLIVLDPY